VAQEVRNFLRRGWGLISELMRRDEAFAVY
jgi:hypothetical protein